MHKLKSLLIFFIATFPVLTMASINLVEKGADNTGTKRIDTIISQSVNELAGQGGGAIYFPAGTYLTRPIHLKSYITLHLEAGAIVRFSDNFDDYLPMIPSRWEGTNVNNFSPLIYAWKQSDITITNCTLLRGHGGVVIGSEMSSGVKKITISNCIFDGTDRGIRIKSARGRDGVVEDIRVNNIIMRDLKKEAIKLNMQYAPTDPESISERTPIFRNIHISNITGTANQTAFLLGLEELFIDDYT
jgi:polygalacturonase